MNIVMQDHAIFTQRFETGLTEAYPGDAVARMRRTGFAPTITHIGLLLIQFIILSLPYIPYQNYIDAQLVNHWMELPVSPSANTFVNYFYLPKNLWDQGTLVQFLIGILSQPNKFSQVLIHGLSNDISDILSLTLIINNKILLPMSQPPTKVEPHKPHGQDFKSGLIGNYYYIRKILKEKKLKDGRIKLFVSWQGWPESCNSWVYKETVTPLDQFLKNVESGSFDSIHSSQADPTKSSKKEEPEESTIHENLGTNKRRKIKKCKIKLERQLGQKQSQEDAKKQPHLCTNCKNNVVQHSEPQVNHPQIKRETEKGKKKSKQQIKSIQKERKQSSIEANTLPIRQKDNQNINTESYKISLEELSSHSEELSRISSINSIGCFKKFSFNTKQNQQTIVSSLKVENNEEKNLIQPAEEIVASNDENTLKIGSIVEENVAKTPEKQKQREQNIQAVINSPENNQTENQTLLLHNTCLERPSEEHSQQAIPEEGTNLLSNLDISFRIDETSMLLFGLDTTKKEKEIVNESNNLRPNQSNWLPKSLWDINQNEQEKSQQSNQCRATIKNEQISEEPTQNEPQPDSKYLTPDKSIFERASDQNGQSMSSNSNSSQESSETESSSSKTTQLDMKGQLDLDGIELRYQKMYGEIYSSNLPGYEEDGSDEESYQSPRFCTSIQQTPQFQVHQRTVKMQQSEAQFESELNKSLLYPDESIPLKNRNAKQILRTVNKKEEQDSHQGRQEDSEQQTTSRSKQSAKILFWQPVLNSNSESSHRQQLKKYRKSKKSTSKQTSIQ